MFGIIRGAGRTARAAVGVLAATTAVLLTPATAQAGPGPVIPPEAVNPETGYVSITEATLTGYPYVGMYISVKGASNVPLWCTYQLFDWDDWRDLDGGPQPLTVKPQGATAFTIGEYVQGVPNHDHSALVHCGGGRPGHVTYAEIYYSTNRTNMGPSIH
ncbi:hypothetical protein [Nocardia bovistercoris]|uniref:Secreted protein n=1 Tax=Nocardia bovistercoris TaxID=2785916 RepID=A0A931IH56_9NOCA|nr:hypothetical protein [Nocardia bovistercoris]MBH0780493.1 hypothetical protein [Nocardia bovistercoris]